MIGIDTFSWGKIIRLHKMKSWTNLIDEAMQSVDWFVTVEGKKEFEHFHSEHITFLEYGTILPVLDERYNHYISKGFDPNDASLLEYVDVLNYRIITEDRPMLLEGVTSKRNIICLIDFFSELAYAHKFLTKKEMYHLTKLFRSWKNISKEKALALERMRPLGT